MIMVRMTMHLSMIGLTGNDPIFPEKHKIGSSKKWSIVGEMVVMTMMIPYLPSATRVTEVKAVTNKMRTRTGNTLGMV